MSAVDAKVNEKGLSEESQNKMIDLKKENEMLRKEIKDYAAQVKELGASAGSLDKMQTLIDENKELKESLKNLSQEIKTLEGSGRGSRKGFSWKEKFKKGKKSE